jgi:hypothetical protein
MVKTRGQGAVNKWIKLSALPIPAPFAHLTSYSRRTEISKPVANPPQEHDQRHQKPHSTSSRQAAHPLIPFSLPLREYRRYARCRRTKEPCAPRYCQYAVTAGDIMCAL